jgi:hypothetical protein
MLDHEYHLNRRVRPGTPAISRADVDAWREARIRNTPFQESVFAAIISPREKPGTELFATIRVDLRGAQIDVPLLDPTPPDELRQEAYDLTFWGAIEPEALREFATGAGRHDPLIALANCTAAEQEMAALPDWFYEQFAVEHSHRYDSIYTTSRSSLKIKGGHDFHAIIAPTIPQKPTLGVVAEATLFAHSVNNEPTLPISIRPLPIDDYTQRVSEALQFLPSDW